MMGTSQIHCADCLDAMREMPDSSIDSIVTDPPYGLSQHSQKDIATCLAAWLTGGTYSHSKAGFMGNQWDNFPPGPDVWRECLRVLKPGGHMLVFAGTRSMDLMSMAIRLAGFELRDAIGHIHEGHQAPIAAWVYGSGMPKGINIQKQITKSTGDADKGEVWAGWNSTLKPCFEPILMFRKPFDGTLCDNVLAHGVGGLNIEACRTRVQGGRPAREVHPLREDVAYGGNSLVGRMDGSLMSSKAVGIAEQGRWPSNIILDDTPAVLASFPDAMGQAGSVIVDDGDICPKKGNVFGARNLVTFNKRIESETSASRFFTKVSVGEGESDASRIMYCPKTSPKDRQEGMKKTEPMFRHGTTLRQVENAELKGNHHPTVKPTELMRHLVRLVTPPGGTVMDPFAGSGSTLKAAVLEGFSCIGIERDPVYAEITKSRVQFSLDQMHLILSEQTV